MKRIHVVSMFLAICAAVMVGTWFYVVPVLFIFCEDNRLRVLFGQPLVNTGDPAILNFFSPWSLSEEDREILLAYIKFCERGFLVDYPTKIKDVKIQYNDAITDKDLEFLAGFPNLEYLMLKETSNITDEGMVILKKLPHLKTLVLRETNVTESGLPLVAELKNLEFLFLQAPIHEFSVVEQEKLPATSPTWEDKFSFSDKSLEILKDTNIKELYMTSATISDEGLKHAAAMKDLELLSIGDSSTISDDGLQHIAKMQNLKKIQFTSDYVTRESAIKLVQALQGKNVHIDISRPRQPNDESNRGREIIDIDKARLVLYGFEP